MTRKYLQLLMIIFIVGTSCSVPVSELTYLGGVKAGLTGAGRESTEAYLIRPHDLLYIRISGEDPQTTEFLNLTESSGNLFSAGNLDLITYEVDDSGEINYSHLGRIRVEGLTVDQVATEIQSRINRFIEGTSVFVKLVERNVTVLGEVANPGRHPMLRCRITLLEALGAAGDLTDFGNRRNVKILRETRDGTVVAYLDLTDPGLVTSPWYYLQPHDIIYVEPIAGIYGKKTRPFGAGMTLALTSMYTLLLLITLLK